MKPQFVPTDMPKVVVRGRFYGDKTFPSLNNYLAEIGRNPRAGGRMKRDYMMICSSAIRVQLKGWKAQRPIILHYIYFEPSKGQKRDVGNIHDMFDKVFEDSLQQCGVIPNDDPAHVVNMTHDFYYTDDEPYIEVYIEELENG